MQRNFATPFDNGRYDEQPSTLHSTVLFPQFEDEFCTNDYLENVINHRFCFNGESHDLGGDIDWRKNPSTDIEWLILLHKFYYAPGLARAYIDSGDHRYRDCFQSLVECWIDQTPPGFIATDVTARRLQNWVYAWHLFDKHDSGLFSHPFKKRFIDSVVEQVNHVLTNMAPARNHRTMALYAVFIAAIAFPHLSIARDWREAATQGMIENVRTDLLSDGVQCELATDYHHIVLRSYLLFFRLARLNGMTLPGDIALRITRALDFAMHIHRPDGDIPALSDSDSKDYRYLLRWGAEQFRRGDYAYVATSGTSGSPPEKAIAIFPEAGYAVLRSPWITTEAYEDARYLVFDAGPIGEGNHGHLDALNIEVAAYGRPLIVDPGRFTYEEQTQPNWREKFRETEAHNTVSVDGANQAFYQYKGKKKKILRPYPEARLVTSDIDSDIPYLHGCVSSPRYDAVHHRHILFVRGRYWLVLDQLEASDRHEYALRFQLTPLAQGRVQTRRLSAAVAFDTPGLSLVSLGHDCDFTIEQGWVSRLYGLKDHAPRVCLKADAQRFCFATVVYPLKRSPPSFKTSGTNNKIGVEIRDEDGCHTWIWYRGESRLTAEIANVTRSWLLRNGNPGV